jgi:hypothetical protein
VPRHVCRSRDPRPSYRNSRAEPDFRAQRPPRSHFCRQMCVDGPCAERVEPDPRANAVGTARRRDARPVRASRGRSRRGEPPRTPPPSSRSALRGAGATLRGARSDARSSFGGLPRPRSFRLLRPQALRRRPQARRGQSRSVQPQLSPLRSRPSALPRATRRRIGRPRRARCFVRDGARRWSELVASVGRKLRPSSPRSPAPHG